MTLAIAATHALAQVAGEEASGRQKGNRWYLAQLDDTKSSSFQKNPSANLINLNFLDTDIRDALSALAMDQEINIATAKEVSGKISIHLFQVTLDQALHAITQAGGFSFYKHGNIYYVFKPKQARDPQIDRLKMRIFKLEYADVGKIQKIIRYWDTAPKQVLIEARILEITLTDKMSLGVEWSAILGDARIGTSSFSRSVLPTGEAVSPVPQEGSGLFFNILTGSSRRQFAAAIDALQEKTNVNTLSTPKVLAIHGQPARVQVGGQQGYSVSQTNLGVTTENIEFIDTGIVLELTPYIDDEGNVLLNVKPSITSAQLEEGIPVTRTAFVETWLLAGNGETVLIGGLIQDTITKTRNEVPCLGDIPALGLLFGSRNRSVDKVELVVLITPRVVDRKKKRLDEVEAIIRTEKVDEQMKKEPLPPHQQILEFTQPWEKTIQNPAGSIDSPSNESPSAPPPQGEAQGTIP